MIKGEAERLVKSKKRVQKHGEVFTPQRTVKDMLNLPGVKEACEELQKTFFEPSAGEGAFLVEVLARKMAMVAHEYSKSMEQYENFSLLALSTLYGVELLEDNAQTCVMNMFQVFNDFYLEQARKHGEPIKKKVQDSAKTLISKNINQGDFLTRKTPDGKPIVFSEWTPKFLRKGQKKITINRTEYSLDDIYIGLKRDPGEAYSTPVIAEQLNLFSFDDDIIEEKISVPVLRYVAVPITEVYKEEMEEVDDNSN
ncbi:methylase [Enterococcus raffinosus]|nr:methylase [Enterococcus raffinosus]MBU5361618.1 methylase [Enterococcus raffinosus]